MTRRILIDLLLGGTAGSLACTRPNAGILSRFQRLIRANDLIMLDALVPEAITVIGAGDWRLVLPEPPGRLSFSPDGAWIAWFPYSNVYERASGGLSVCFTNSAQSARRIKLEGRHGAALAVSSGAERLAVCMAVAAGPVSRLVVIKVATGEIQDDVSDLISRFDLRTTERMRLSASGDRLVVGSPSHFSLIDLPSRKLVLEGEGRFPCISPSGEALAYVDGRRELSLTTVATGTTKRLLEHSITHGVGSWTPDGELLFAGVEGPLSFFPYLSVVDCIGDGCATIARLEEHDGGQECGLIKRRLLTPGAHRASV